MRLHAPAIVKAVMLERIGILCHRDNGFRPAREEGPHVLRIAATAPNYWRLLRGLDDADRLFFERALLMEGDTEFGLVLKRTRRDRASLDLQAPAGSRARRVVARDAQALASMARAFRSRLTTVNEASIRRHNTRSSV